MKYKTSFPGLGRVGLVFLVCGAFAALGRGAIPIGSSNVQIGGFFSQGYAESKGNNYPFQAKGGTFDFREMAVNISSPIGSHLRVGAQGFAEDLGNYGQDKVILDWANADYNFRQEFGVRIGRIKYPKGLYGEALDLDMIRPFVFLPQALYSPVTRDFNSAFNGAMLYGSLSAGKAGTVDYKLFYGDIPMNPSQGVADFFNTTSLYASPGVRDLGMDHASGLQLVWATPLSGLRLVGSYSALNKVQGDGKFAYYPVVDVHVLGKNYSYTTLSAEYVWKDWTFAAEWEQTKDTFTVTTPISPTDVSKNGTSGWYISSAWRINSRFEIGTYYSQQQNDNAAPGTAKNLRQIGDWALSLRFDLNEHVLFKIEGHQVDGRYSLFNTVRTPNPTKVDDYSYFAVKTTLSF